MANLGDKALGRKLYHWEYSHEGKIGTLDPLIIFLLLSYQDSVLHCQFLLHQQAFFPEFSYQNTLAISQVQSNGLKKTSSGASNAKSQQFSSFLAV